MKQPRIITWLLAAMLACGGAGAAATDDFLAPEQAFPLKAELRDARSIVLTHGDPEARAWFAEQLAVQAPKSKVLDPVPLKTYQV